MDTYFFKLFDLFKIDRCRYLASTHYIMIMDFKDFINLTKYACCVP